MKHLSGKRVFVTGGAGVIGLELVPRLLSMGAIVFVGDLKPQPVKFSGLVTYRQGDLNDLTISEFLEFAPDILIHLAATFERSSETLSFWGENFHHNVKLSHHLMTLGQQSETLKRIIFASSYLIYDQNLYQFNEAQTKPKRLSETDPIRPRNLTGMAKLAHERELEFLASFDECKFSTLSVRIFRGYGRRSRDVISRWVRSLLRGEKISVYRPEGIFDYINAADSAEGLARLTFCDSAVGIVNLGTGHARRVSDVIAILKQYFPSASIEHQECDIDFEASEACTQRLESLVNWKPNRTLEETIPEIIHFEKKRLSEDFLRSGKKRPLDSLLITSASKKIPLARELRRAAIRLDKEIKIIAGDCDLDALAQFEADSFWNMPRLDEISIDALIQECQAREVSVIFPTRDGELEFWSQNNDLFDKAGIEVIVSSYEAISRCRDKLAFATFGEEVGLPIIPAAKSPEGLNNCLFVVKERYGAGSRGIGLGLSKEAALEHAKGLAEPIFQPFINGPEVSIDSWVSRTGDVPGVVLRRRDIVVSGESQVTTTFKDAHLENDAIKVIQALQLRGPVVLQAIVTDKGLQIIECNPRFGGASTAAIAAGLDSLYWSLAEVEDNAFRPIFHRTTDEIRQIRYPFDRVIHGSHF